MHKRWLKKYGGWFVLGLFLIATYKLFDELIFVSNWFLSIIKIVQPFLIGAILAYLLYIPSSIVERSLKKQKKSWIKAHAQGLSITICYLIFILIVIGIVMYLVPVIRSNVGEILDRLPIYNLQLKSFFKNLSREFSVPNFYELLNEKLMTSISSIVGGKEFDAISIISHGMGIVSALFSWLMAIVVCPYILVERQNLLRLFDKVMRTRICERDLRLVHRYAAKINAIFSNFLFGKAMDSFIIGLIAYVAFSLMGLKFDLLLALVIMITNMIPYFGPFIGGIPVTVITFLSMGMTSGIWTAIFIIALQQFDGLILGPYILGESVGVSALWIIFAVTFFGGTMGFVGMVIGVPLIAVIRMVFNDWIRYRTIKEAIRKGETLSSN